MCAEATENAPGAQAGSNGTGPAHADEAVPFTFMTYNVLADSLVRPHALLPLLSICRRLVTRAARAWSRNPDASRLHVSDAAAMAGRSMSGASRTAGRGACADEGFAASGWRRGSACSCEAWLRSKPAGRSAPQAAVLQGYYHQGFHCAPQAQKHWAQLYRGVPQGALAWGGPGGRCARLLAEIGRHAPDVVALQEVDRFQGMWTALSAAGCALDMGFQHTAEQSDVCE